MDLTAHHKNVSTTYDFIKNTFSHFRAVKYLYLGSYGNYCQWKKWHRKKKQTTTTKTNNIAIKIQKWNYLTNLKMSGVLYEKWSFQCFKKLSCVVVSQKAIFSDLVLKCIYLSTLQWLIDRHIPLNSNPENMISTQHSTVMLWFPHILVLTLFVCSNTIRKKVVIRENLGKELVSIW